VANYCLKLASEQEKVASERWLPELRTVIQEARRCFEDCQRIRGLVSEYYISFTSLCSCLCLFSKISIIWPGYSIYGLPDIKHTSNFQAIAFNLDHLQFCLCFSPVTCLRNWSTLADVLWLPNFPSNRCTLEWANTVVLCNVQVDEWYEQPAATIVDWVTIDGQSVGAWINLVKQLHMEISRRTLAMSSVGDD
jgi:hypothetical protein